MCLLKFPCTFAYGKCCTLFYPSQNAEFNGRFQYSSKKGTHKFLDPPPPSGQPHPPFHSAGAGLLYAPHGAMAFGSKTLFQG